MPKVPMQHSNSSFGQDDRAERRRQPKPRPRNLKMAPNLLEVTSSTQPPAQPPPPPPPPPSPAPPATSQPSLASAARRKRPAAAVSTAADGGERGRGSGRRRSGPVGPASAGFEVGKHGWSVANNNRTTSANNPDDDDEEEADFDESKLSPFYDGYNTRKLLEKWRDLPSRLTMSDWAFYVKTTRRRSQRSQVDKLVSDVCSKVLSMRELVHYSLDSGAHCLLWLNSSLSQRFISGMRKGTHIIGRIKCDVMMKDKQNLSNFLCDHQFKEWIECSPHVCLNEKNEEIKRNLQRICRHQYTGHYMGKCTDEISGQECPNFDYYFCECFRRHIFIPEFYTFSHYYLMEEFLKKYETDEEFKKTTWLAKPAYLTAGKGFFMIRDAREFRYFYLVRSDTCVRREGYVLQRYLTRPCTINSYKIDCRMYLVITVTNGRRVSGFFHPGYVRTAASPWTVKLEHKGKVSGNIFEHVTAPALYKLANARMPGESEEDDDDEKKQCIPFNEACEQITTGGKKVKKGEIDLPAAFANEDEGPGGNLPEKEFEKFHWRFKYMIEVLCAKLDPVVRDKVGTFQIFGLDILIDSDAKPWLLEVNSHAATEQVYDTSQCRVISNVVTEGICIMCEMFQKSLQEELITIELQQGDQRLSKLNRSQRMMTAKAEQEALDKLQLVLEQTEISQRRPPVFLQNFFWWYDTPRYRWLKPWVTRKKPTRKEVPWYSRVFLGLASRNDAIRRKNFKADEITASHDAMDYYKHIFWREKLESDTRRFEVEKLSKRAEIVSSGGASAAGAGTSVAGGGAGAPRGSISTGQQQQQDQDDDQNQLAFSASNVAGALSRQKLETFGATQRTRSTDDNNDNDEDEDQYDEDDEDDNPNKDLQAALELFKVDGGCSSGGGRMPRLPTADDVLNDAHRDSAAGPPHQHHRHRHHHHSMSNSGPNKTDRSGRRYRTRFADETVR